MDDPGPSSLTERLTATVNRVRARNTTMGLRPYRVFVVRRHWTGGQVGRGDVCETECLELLPRPKVSFRTRREYSAAGYVERGLVILTEVNPALTEGEVLDLFGQKLDTGDELFVEVTMDARDGQSARRRCTVIEPPTREAFSWRVVLRQQDGARASDGSTSYPGRR
jgi:hypothetical protein